VGWPLNNIVNQDKGEGGRVAWEGLAFFSAQKMPIYLIDISGLLIRTLNLY